MKTLPADLRAPRSTLLLLPPSSDQQQSSHSNSKHLDIAEMVKRKLRLGAKIVRAGGVEKMYRRVFKSVREGERLLRASQCYLWTTSGPIAGSLFISIEKVAFCSDKPIKFTSQRGGSLRSYYKVSIPLRKISTANQGENNGKSQSEKCLQVVTGDEFEFWFMGFVGFRKTFKCLQQALAQAYLIVCIFK